MKNEFNNELISNLPIGYALHKIVLDKSGTPIDYVFLDVNDKFERYTGLKKEDILNKSVLEVIPNLKDDDFDWISFYGDIALNNGFEELIEHSSPLNHTYRVTVYSPKKEYFVTLFSDYTNQEQREEVLHNIIQLAPIPIMVHAEDREVVHISDTWTDISGYEHKDIPTIDSWTKKAYGMKQDEVIDVIDALYHLDERQHDGEFEVTAKDGKKLLWDFYSTYLGKLKDGRKIAMSVALDITAREQLKIDLEKEKHLFETTLLSVGDGVITTDLDGNVTLLNSVAEELTGWKNNEAKGHNINDIFDIYNDKTKNRSSDIIMNVIKNKKRQNLANSTILLSKDGTNRPIADSAAPIINEDNEVTGVIVVFRDYTEKYEEQKKRQNLIDQLNETKILLQSSLNSPDDIMIISLDTEYKYLYFNDAHKKVMKHNFDASISIGKSIFDYVTEDFNTEEIKYDFDKALSGTSHKTIKRFSKENINIYEVKFNPIFDDEKAIIGVTVFAENVTARINMEQTIIEEEERYKGLVENLYEGVIIHAPDTSIISANTKATTLLGISTNDIKGMKSSNRVFEFINEKNEKLQTDEYPVNLIRESKRPLKDFIMGIRNENSMITWVSVNGIPILNKTNETLKEIVISFRDITSEKQAKEDLKFAAYKDYLTGLYNRRYYQERLEELDVPSNYPLTIVMADINGLKLINDAFGHETGDELLIEAAKLLQSHMSEEDLLARIGGDEFIIVLPNMEEQETNKMLSAIKEEANQIKFNSIPLSISFGFSTKRDKEESIRNIYQDAEDIMYREKLLEIPSMRSSTIETILNTLYEKDKRSEEHSRAVSKISEQLAFALKLSMSEISEIKTAGLLHDIGKIIIPTTILNKTGILTDDEYAMIKTHPEIGFRILNSTQTMRPIANIVLSHHERWDGKGYPRKIKENDIPLKSRIISVADAFDAMISIRSYRTTLSYQEALQELIDNSGTQFDPEVVQVFKEHFETIKNVIEE